MERVNQEFGWKENFENDDIYILVLKKDLMIYLSCEGQESQLEVAT